LGGAAPTLVRLRRAAMGWRGCAALRGRRLARLRRVARGRLRGGLFVAGVGATLGCDVHSAAVGTL
jgi:hypothetical protein